MKCSKCGFEYEEGRSCPKCGENAIRINEDYYRRRKEWEEKNTPKEEEETAKRFSISPEAWKKIIVVLVSVLLLGLIAQGIVTVALEYVRTHTYSVGFASGEERIFTCDGGFSYEKPEAFSSVPGERREIFCSVDGMAVATVIYEEQKKKYCLYVSYREESRLAYETGNAIWILRVNADGSVVLREMTYGNYDIVTECRIIEVSEKVRILTEKDMTMIETGQDKVYCFHADGQVLIFENGRSVSFYVEDADELIYTSDGVYYLGGSVLYNTAGEQIDSGVFEIFHVYGTEELIYLKEGKLVLLEPGKRKVEFTNVDLEGIITENPVFLRRGNKIYYKSGEDAVILDKNASETKETVFPYLFLK